MPHSRRALLKAAGSLLLLPVLAGRSLAAAVTTNIRRLRPSDSAWPSQAAWQRLNAAVGGKLIPVPFALNDLRSSPDSAAAAELLKELRNPYWIADQVGMTQTLGGVDAWATRPRIY